MQGRLGYHGQLLLTNDHNSKTSEKTVGWLKVAPANQGKVTGDETANQKTVGITGVQFSHSIFS